MGQITLQGVRKSFGPVNIIKDANLDIEDGSFVVFVGPSGCGKTTLLRLIAGLEDVSGGQILIDGAAQVIEMDLDFVFGNAQPKAKSHQLKLDPSGGVRDLAALGSDILILSGSEDDDTGNAAIHLWNGSGGAAQKLCDLPDPPKGSKDKPEALHVLTASDQAVHVLVLSDGVAGGNPREFILKRQ